MWPMTRCPEIGNGMSVPRDRIVLQVHRIGDGSARQVTPAWIPDVTCVFGGTRSNPGVTEPAEADILRTGTGIPRPQVRSATDRTHAFCEAQRPSPDVVRRVGSACDGPMPCARGCSYLRRASGRFNGAAQRWRWCSCFSGWAITPGPI